MNLPSSRKPRDRESFELLVRSQGKRLYSLALRITGDTHLAEDVVQETFTRYLEDRAPFREEGAVEGWLARVATRIAIDVLRRKPARRRREESHSALRPETESPDGEVLRREEALLLGRYLDELAVETRAAVWLHVVEGQSIREVAACLGSTRSTVNRRIQSGLERLRAALSRAGLTLAPAMSVEDLLRRLPPAEPPGGLLSRLESLVELRAGGGGALVAGAARSGPAAGHRAIRAAAVTLVIGLGAFLGFRLFLPDREPGNGGPASGPVARIEPRRADLEKAPNVPPAAPTPEGGDAARIAGQEVGIRISGRVLDRRGAPSAGAEVHLHEDIAQRDIHEMLDAWSFLEILEAALEGPHPIASTRTDGEGKFELRLPAPAHSLIHGVSADGEESGFIHVASGGAGDEVVVEMVPALAQKGRVVSDTDGVAVGGARVAIVPDPTPPLDRDLTSFDVQALLDLFVPAWTDADREGRFVLPPVPTSPVLRHRIIARSEGFAAEHTLVPEGGGDIEVRLRRRTPLPGHVVRFQGGPPAAGVRLLAIGGEFPTGSAESRRGWFAMGRTGSSGEFVLEGAADGKYIVLAKEKGRLVPAKLELDPSSELPLSIVLGGESELHGTARFAESGEPARGLRILCRSIEGAYATAEAITDDRGAYGFQGLPAGGGYELIVVLPGYLPRDPLPREGLGAPSSMRHDIELVRTAAVEGKVLGPDGELVPGASVEVFATTNDLAEGTRLRWRAEILEKTGFTTDARGAFRADDVPSAGKIYAWAYHSRLGEAFAGPVSLEGDPPAGLVELKLDQAGLDVAARTAAGDPLQGVFVSLDSETVWGWVPDGYHMLQWFVQLTSLDLSRFSRELGMVPGGRSGTTDAGGTCRWMDLSAASYRFSVSLSLKEGRVSNWEAEYWLWMGTMEPLRPKEVRKLDVVVDSRRRVEGKVVAKSGALPRLRVQVWFNDCLPGMKNSYGYSVTHTREDGSFRAEGVGPGPYRVWMNEDEGPMLRVNGVPEGEAVTLKYWRPEEEG